MTTVQFIAPATPLHCARYADTTGIGRNELRPYITDDGMSVGIGLLSYTDISYEARILAGKRAANWLW